MNTKVPFNDLRLHHESLEPELSLVIADVISRSEFVRGPKVNDFEKNFSSLFDVNHCVSCANGTDALYIAMKGLAVAQDSEVIVPAHSWISTSETVTQAGGNVVFCDTNPDDFTINTRDIRKKITEKTVGIIPVHLYGQPADMQEIMAIAEEFGLWVLEDCAQAHLAVYKGQKVGTFGSAATFSFYPGKNLGALGDAGAIVTANQELALQMAKFSRHGGLSKGQHEIEGVNSRLDGLQAAVLNLKLSHLQHWTSRRQEIAAQYHDRLCEVRDLVLPTQQSDRSHVWHLYVVKTDRRDELASHLAACGIQTVINYPVALPFLPAYKYLGHQPRDFPVAHANQSIILSLPIYPEMTEQQVDYVCAAIKKFFQNN